MMCRDCNKPRAYPIIDRVTDKIVCPVCFGGNIHDVDQDATDLARAQKWYFSKPEGGKRMSTSQEEFENKPKELETIEPEDVGKMEDILGDLLK
jgi:hypothetical protein